MYNLQKTKFVSANNYQYILCLWFSLARETLMYIIYCGSNPNLYILLIAWKGDGWTGSVNDLVKNTEKNGSVSLCGCGLLFGRLLLSTSWLYLFWTEILTIYSQLDLNPECWHQPCVFSPRPPFCWHPVNTTDEYTQPLSNSCCRGSHFHD